MASTDGNDTTPSATETYFAEIFVPCNMTVTGVSIFNGSAVGTDKLVGIIWDVNGTALGNTATAGTTASGTDTYQSIALTAQLALKGPATYFVGIQVNGTTYRFNSWPIGAFVAGKKTSTTFGTVPSITPGSSFTANLGPMITLY